jgi:hypothetical protein
VSVAVEEIAENKSDCCVVIMGCIGARCHELDRNGRFPAIQSVSTPIFGGYDRIVLRFTGGGSIVAAIVITRLGKEDEIDGE